METKPITIAANINARIDKVWDYWNNPEHITQWNFASDDWCCPRSSNDLRVGGKLNSRMEAKDGSFGFDFEAIYDEVIEQKRIAYTMLDGRKAITDFSETDGGTHVTTSFDPDTQNPIDMQRDGWQAILGNFKKYVEGKK